MAWDTERLESEFGRICRKLDRIDALLRGNGSEGGGVLVRVEKLELRERIRSKLLWLVSSIVLSMVVLLVWKFFLGVTSGDAS